MVDSKSRKISDEFSRNKKGKKDEVETRKYLLKTLSLLQQNVKPEKHDKKYSNSQLSMSVYEIVKKNVNTKSTVVSKSPLQDYSSMQMGK